MTSSSGHSAQQRGWFRKEVLESLAAGGTVIAAALYGYGWLVLAQFYGSFEVNPEDVGVTFAFITVRVALVMAVLGSALALVFLPIRAFGRARLDVTRIARPPSLEVVRFLRDVLARAAGRPESVSSPPLTGRIIRRYLFWVWVTGFALAGPVLVLLDTFGVVELPGDNTKVDTADIVAGWMLLAVLIAPVWVGLLILGLDLLVRRISRSSISWRLPALVLTGALVVGVLVVLVAGVWLLPRTMAATVRGHDLRATVPYLSIVGLRADSVQVTAVGGGPVSPRLPGGCVRLLGSANGVTVLFDPAQQLLVRAPSEHLLVERPCR